MSVLRTVAVAADHCPSLRVVEIPLPATLHSSSPGGRVFSGLQRIQDGGVGPDHREEKEWNSTAGRVEENVSVWPDTSC